MTQKRIIKVFSIYSDYGSIILALAYLINQSPNKTKKLIMAHSWDILIIFKLKNMTLT